MREYNEHGTKFNKEVDPHFARVAHLHCFELSSSQLDIQVLNKFQTLGRNGKLIDVI